MTVLLDISGHYKRGAHDGCALRVYGRFVAWREIPSIAYLSQSAQTVHSFWYNYIILTGEQKFRLII